MAGAAAGPTRRYGPPSLRVKTFTSSPALRHPPRRRSPSSPPPRPAAPPRRWSLYPAGRSNAVADLGAAAGPPADRPVRPGSVASRLARAGRLRREETHTPVTAKRGKLILTSIIVGSCLLGGIGVVALIISQTEDRLFNQALVEFREGRHKAAADPFSPRW